MPRTATTITCSLVLLAAPAFARPAAAPLTPEPALAQVTKSRDARGSDSGTGSANISRAGERLGDLLAGWAVPVLIVAAGCLLIAALGARSIGTAVGVVVITLLGLIFLLTPDSIEALAKGISNFVF